MLIKVTHSCSLIVIVCLLNLFHYANTSYSFTWKDPNSNSEYNYESLKRDYRSPWEVKDGTENGLFSMVYLFNFGQDNGFKCKDQFGSVTEVLEVWGQRTDTCDNLGKHTIVTNGLLDNNNPKQGFFIQYGGGDICDADDPIENGKPRKTTFKIYCSNNQDKNFILDYPGQTQGSTKCNLEFRINSPMGCPVEHNMSSTAILIWLIIVFSIYFGFGFYLNTKTRNLSGKDAIPNIEFWRSLPFLVQEGLFYTVKSIENIIKFTKSKLSKNDSNLYSTL